jgi:hypothetical protein
VADTLQPWPLIDLRLGCGNRQRGCNGWRLPPERDQFGQTHSILSSASVGIAAFEKQKIVEFAGKTSNGFAKRKGLASARPFSFQKQKHQSQLSAPPV